METKEVIAKLREGKKRKFDQSLDLVVNLKVFDVRREALNTFVFVPHGMDKKFAAFFAKRNDKVSTITEEDYVKYRALKDIKKLAKKYDQFLLASIKVRVGKESMSDDELAENVDVAIKELEKKLPKGVDNVKDVLVKFTMGKPVKLR